MHQIQTRVLFIPKDVCMSPFKKNTSTNASVVAEEDAPSGMLARGHYTAVSTFVDDDKKTHLQFEWAFDIEKTW